MLAIPDEHLLKFHTYKDAKSLWKAIKNRFGGNKESKKMQKTILKQNYKNFAAKSQEGLDKTTNETVNTAHSVSAASYNDQASTASYVDDVMFSFFSNHSNALQLDNEDFKQINTDDPEEIDLKWQVAECTSGLIYYKCLGCSR
nr:ribonuclease H-like domain-containing protein [Tanacetum cinerariifolium]